MPPQPLSSVSSDAVIVVGASAAKFRPRLAQMAAYTVATWADIECQFGGMLVTMLGANAIPAAAMFYALTSSSAQTAALEAAAESVLGHGSRELDLFDVIIKRVKISANHRHRFAHWVWAYSPDLEDAILFVKPEALVEHDINDRQLQAPHDGRGLLGEIDRSRVYIYKERDLKEAIADVREASYCISQFRMILIPHPGPRAEWQDHIYQNLSSRRWIAEALAHLRERRKSDSTARPSRRRKGRSKG